MTLYYLDYQGRSPILVALEPPCSTALGKTCCCGSIFYMRNTCYNLSSIEKLHSIQYSWIPTCADQALPWTSGSSPDFGFWIYLVLSRFISYYLDVFRLHDLFRMIGTFFSLSCLRCPLLSSTQVTFAWRSTSRFSWEQESIWVRRLRPTS